MRKVFLFMVIALVSFGIFKGITFYIEDKNAWKVEILNDFINVRKDHSSKVEKLAQVSKGKLYNVEEIYLDDSRYVWYKIEYEKNKYGWISSGRNNPYVKEINNPNNDYTVSYFIDYKKPIIRYYDEIYYATNVDSINYEHLTIEEDSNYDIKNNIYYEAEPLDNDKPQYWIEYIVTDDFNNSSSIVQKIVFEENPCVDDVLDFSKLENKRN